MNKLNSKILGYSAAVVASICMLILGILGNLGIYEGAVEAMAKWHLFFDLSLVGIIGGIIEAAVISFILGYFFAAVYNKLLKGEYEGRN